MGRQPGRLRGPSRLWRSISISLDHYRIWHKVTYERGRVLATVGEDWKSLDVPAYFENPSLFYRSTGAPPAVTQEIAGRIAGAEVIRFAFPTLHPVKFPESNTAVGRYYRNTRAPGAPVVLISHGWAHRRLATIEHLYVRPFLRAGFSVVFVAHPLHFERTPPGTYSGELVVSADVVLTVEAFRQGVIDLLGTADWLRASGSEAIGLFGYSLGGYLAGLLAAARGDWSFVVLGGAGDSPISPILDTELGRNIRQDLEACGMLDREKLTRAWKVISPGAFHPRVPRERILMLAGRYDRIMLPASVRRLWSAWGRPRLLWLDRGHYTLLATNRGLMARAVPFMRDMTHPRRLLERGSQDAVSGAGRGAGREPRISNHL
jgi:pimeloyl-ACP methyl ester carboxylesterase